MKSFKFVGMAIIAMVMGVNFVSCSSDDGVVAIEPEVESPKEYTVSLGWKGEILNISDSPLTYATASNDLYGVQVYSCPDIKEGNEGSDYQYYNVYAYGLFDDVGKMNIKLLEGYQYKFVATMVVDGKNKVRSWGDKFGDPFYISGSNAGSISLNNTFKYSSFDYLNSSYLGGGHSYSSIMDMNVWRPEQDRYYGELEGYLPSEGGTATINMKRTSFGVKIIAQEMTEGKLTVKIEHSIDLFIEHPESEAQELLTFRNVSEAWQNDTYSEQIPISFSWTKEDGVELPLGTQTIEFKRNKLTTITIKVVEKSIGGEIGITLEETGEMGDGGTVNIDSTGSTDNEVNPQP